MSSQLKGLLREFLIVISFTFLILLGFALFAPPVPHTHQPPREIDIKRGMNVREIAHSLGEKGLIGNQNFFLFFAKICGWEKSLKAGRYRIRPGVSLWQILRTLSQGVSITEDVTIPEGFTFKEIADLLQSQRKLEVDSTAFVAIVTNPGFCRKLGVNTSNLEGYLFPNTYRLCWGMKEEEIVKLMVNELFKVFTFDLKARAEELGLSLNQVLTLASLIEEETGIPQERPLISAVFHRRLKRGMPLQCDPTVIYILSPLNHPLNKRDLKVKSPYNTYLHPGLPPGPICNPGLESIKATLWPAKTDYLYFVAQEDGSHIFSRTNREHINARRRIKYLQRKEF
jgi:UPF0755 protein